MVYKRKWSYIIRRYVLLKDYPKPISIEEEATKTIQMILQIMILRKDTMDQDIISHQHMNLMKTPGHMIHIKSLQSQY